VPVVDAESLIGLKLQALANKSGRMQDEADIRALMAAGGSRLDVGLLRDCLRLFDHGPALGTHDATRTPAVVKRRRNPLVGRGVRSQAILRPPVPVRDLDQFLLFLRRMRTRSSVAATAGRGSPRPATAHEGGPSSSTVVRFAARQHAVSR
jgi:hypothetical protein